MRQCRLIQLTNFGASHYVNRDYAYERHEDREHLREALLMAGLPEQPNVGEILPQLAQKPDANSPIADIRLGG